MSITEDERLALLVAMDKQLKPLLDDAKADARRGLLASYEADGFDRRAVKVGGVKVGEVGVSAGKPRLGIRAGREAEALACLRELGLTREVPVDGWERHFGEGREGTWCLDTGEAVSWAEWTPGRTTAAVRGCEPQKVVAAFGGRLRGASVAALLEGEIDMEDKKEEDDGR